MSTLTSVHLGVSPLSWTNNTLEDLGGNIPLEVCLREAAEAGYEGVELGRKFPRHYEALHPVLRDYGLQLAGGWYTGRLAERSVEEELEAARSHVELIAKAGAPVIIYGEAGGRPEKPQDLPLSMSPQLGSIDVERYAHAVTKFSEAITREFGVELSYHPHLMMLVETWPEIVEFFSRTGPAVRMLLDTGHAEAAGADVADIVARFGHLINHIHLKDVRKAVLHNVQTAGGSFNTGVREGMFTVPGDGDVSFDSVASFVQASGYKGWLIVEAEQDPVKAPPFETVVRASQFVRSTFRLGEAA
jgi:inosose dehydratase